MRIILSELRYGFRVLTKSPGFTAVAALILALGVGASTAIFSILDAEAIRPLPYEDPGRLVVIWKTDPRSAQWTASGADFLDWAKQSDVFSALAGAMPFNPALTDAGENVRLRAYRVTPDFFKVLGVKPASGRLFAAEDEQPGRDHMLVLGARFQAREPGRNPTALGSTLNLDKEEFAVIGSIPASFRFPAINPGTETDAEVYAPFPAEVLTEVLTKERQGAWLWVIGRLKPGITLRQAQAQMATIASRRAQQFPDTNAGMGVRVVSLRDQVVGSSMSIVSRLLWGVGLLLLIACANVAIMLLTRGARREREVAIRQAVGASRTRITVQLLTESILLALAGGALGVLLAFWFKDALLLFCPAGLIPQVNPIQINGQVLAFALVLSVTTGVLFGLIPALQLSRVNLEGLLREGAQAAGTGARSVGFRDFLVVSEVALALSLLIVCGLSIRALTAVLLSKPEFNPKNLMTISFTIADSKHPTFAARSAFSRELIERVNALPGIQSSALQGMSLGHLASLDNDLTPTEFRKRPFTFVSVVSPEYFRTMQIPLLRGRQLSAADYVENPSVAIVDPTLAASLWPNQDALGKRFTVTYPPHWYEVVGIAAEGHYLTGAPMPSAILPNFPNRGQLLVRTVGEPERTIPSIRNLISDLDKDVRVSSIWTVEESREKFVAPFRFIAFILSTMAVIALLLATIGVYAVTAFSAAQRTHEIGVRMALGARRGQVLLLVMRHGIRLSFLGVIIGLFLALGLSRVLAFFLHGVTVGDISTYIGVSLLQLLVTLLASYIPARHATRIDPISALRYE
ncbi:MAG: ABC transporter permease [Acidobacteriota bacterium]|nr:ABC transporter permease [Acidobacteriota bacterium]